MMLSIFSCASGHSYIFFGEMSIKIHYPFLNWIVTLLLSCKFSLYTLDTVLSSKWFANIFSQCMSLPFHFLDGVLWSTKFKILIWSTLFFFLLLLVLLLSKKPLPNPRLQRFTPMFSSKSFIVFALRFRSMIYFRWGFFVWFEVRVHLRSFVCGYTVIPTLLKRLFFLHWIFLASLF